MKREDDGESHATKHILEVKTKIDEGQNDCNILKIQYLERENLNQKMQIEKLNTIHSKY